MRCAHVLFTTIGVLLSAASSAQNKTERATVEWGPDLETGDHGTFGSILHTDEDALYATMYKKKEAFITKYDLGFHVRYSKLLPWEIDKKDHALEGVFFMGDRIYVFSSYYDKKQDRLGLYRRIFDKANMAPIGRMEMIHSITAESSRNKGSYVVKVSPNERSLLVLALLPFEKEGNEQFAVKVYDAAGDINWERTVELPYSDKEYRQEELRVDDDGAVLILGVKYDEKREARAKEKKGEVFYTYHLLVMKDASSGVEDTPIEVAGKFLHDMTMAIGKDGHIFCGGYWGNKNSWNARGAYFLRMDRATKRIDHESFKEFDNDFITSYMTEKEEKKATKKAEKKGEDLEMYKFKLYEIVLRDDGGAILVGEQAYDYVVCYTDSKGNTRCSTHYIHNDIILVNIDPEGDIEWAAKVPKRQHTVNDGGFYSSFALGVKGTNMYAVFNDSGKNLFLKQGDKVEQFELKGNEALITLATITEDGTVHREALLAPDKRDAILSPSFSWQIEDDRMFVYAKRKKEYRFGWITFQ